MFVVLSFNIDLWYYPMFDLFFRPNILSKFCCLCSYDMLYKNCHSFLVDPFSSIANTICWRLLSAFISELKSLVFISISVTQGSNQYLTKGQWSVKDFRKGTRVYTVAVSRELLVLVLRFETLFLVFNTWCDVSHNWSLDMRSAVLNRTSPKYS